MYGCNKEAVIWAYTFQIVMKYIIIICWNNITFFLILMVREGNRHASLREVPDASERTAHQCSRMFTLTSCQSEEKEDVDKSGKTYVALYRPTHSYIGSSAPATAHVRKWPRRSLDISVGDRSRSSAPEACLQSIFILRPHKPLPNLVLTCASMFPKSSELFQGQTFDRVIILCDTEHFCPTFSGSAKVITWNTPDPVKAERTRSRAVPCLWAPRHGVEHPYSAVADAAGARDARC